jgi:hypothetical protein
MAKKTKAHDSSLLKKRFLEAFRQTGNITQAAALAGMDRKTHYDWLEKDPQGYGKEFRDAEEHAIDLLEAEAWRRGLKGVRKPVGWHQGKPGGFVREYSDTLLIFLLKGARPEKYRERFEHVGKDGEALFKIYQGVKPEDV